MDTSTATELWAQFIADLQYDRLPAVVIQSAKISILDTLAALLAGTTSPTGEKIARLVKNWGGAPESTMGGEDCRIPAMNAAFANAIFSRARELDNALEMLPFHASVVMIPVGLAMAEQKGSLSGRDFIVAIALGVELAGRMGLASKTTGVNRVPNARSIWGTLGAATVGAKILGFKKKEILHAMGIAFRLGGGSELSGGDDETLWLGCGIDALHGILSCSMASQGLTGPPEVMEEYYCRYEAGEYDRHALAGELGQTFLITQTSLKAWPTCRMSHASIEATLAIIQKHELVAEDIEEIRVSLNQLAFERACLPLEQKRTPSKVEDALFSIPFAIGVAVVKRKVSIGEFTPATLADPKILRISRSVVPTKNPDVKHPVGRPPAVVTIRTKSGEEYTRRVDYIKGNPKNPLSRQDLLDKFKDCAAWAKNPLSNAKLEKIIHFVDDLENKSDIREFIHSVLGGNY